MARRHGATDAEIDGLEDLERSLCVARPHTAQREVGLAPSQCLGIIDVVSEGYTTLRIYDASGRLVATPVDGMLGQGAHTVSWDGRGRPSGMYFYQLTNNGTVETRKMMLLK